MLSKIQKSLKQKRKEIFRNRIYVFLHVTLRATEVQEVFVLIYISTNKTKHFQSQSRCEKSRDSARNSFQV